jgi:chromosomal replication initiator protein
MQAKQLWQAALDDLRRSTSQANYETWLRNTQVVEFEDDCATIGAPNSFAVEQLRNKFAVPIQKTLSVIAGRPIAVQFSVMQTEKSTSSRRPQRQRKQTPAQESGPATNGSAKPAAVTPVETPSELAAQQLELTSKPEHGLNPKYIFENFVVGSSNQLAHAAAMAVADRPAESFNPLFLYGGVGLGKTHLLHAIGHRAWSRRTDLSIKYVSSEAFMNDLIQSIRTQNTEEFRNRYRTIDILMIDDIQFIAGKESTQEEFFHTFNALHQAGKQIVISSDRPPKSIPTLHDRLRSRFEGGLIADLQPPDVEMREAIIAEKGRALGREVPPDVVQYLARKVESNIRELEGALNKIIALADIYQRPMTTELAVQAMTDQAIELRRQSMTTEQIISVVVEFFGISRAEIVGKGRRKDLVRPRQIAMYLSREEVGASLVEIGNALGKRDHSTVVHGIEKIEGALQNDQRLRDELIDIRERLYSTPIITS